MKADLLVVDSDRSMFVREGVDSLHREDAEYHVMVGGRMLRWLVPGKILSSENVSMVEWDVPINVSLVQCSPGWLLVFGLCLTRDLTVDAGIYLLWVGGSNSS